MHMKAFSSPDEKGHVFSFIDKMMSFTYHISKTELPDCSKVLP